MRWALGLLVFGSLQCGARSELEVGQPVEKAPECGNGVVEAKEECDDGNDVDGDRCTNACKLGDCGDGDLDPGEDCDLGDDNEDRPALLLTQLTLWRPVMPVDRSQHVVSFYNYVSESAHTGFERFDLSALYLYRDTQTGELDLITHHGIDEDSTGITLPEGHVEMDLGPLPQGAAVLLGDEGQELTFDGPNVLGRWEFWRNTDGGVLGPLPFPGNWSIEVRMTFLVGITTWRYVDADGTEVSLTTDAPAVLTAFATPSACRTDCTIPRCGDGIVDGGEVCDDGNIVDRDGCASDCRSLHGR